MEAFRVSTHLKGILGSYPDANRINHAAKNGGESARIAIARQWLSEGIPYAFRDCPGLYESIRTWLATRLTVDPKEINITGSARLGQSLSPNKMGTPFRNESDLDIFIVSIDLFEKHKNDYNQWTFDFESGNVSAKNDREQGFWRDNYIRGEKNLSRGFIDTNLVPNHTNYKTIKNVSQTMWLLKEKLDITQDAPTISKASVRCYRSWDDYVKQIILSLV